MKMRKAFSSGKIMKQQSRLAKPPCSRVRGQQEMVGFVLIVIIVIVGILVFLVFTLRQDEVSENDIVNNVLSAILKTTSSCSIGSERNYNDMKDLFRSCYEGKRCFNTLEMACDTLDDSLRSILDEVLVLEPTITAYQLDFSVSDSEGILSIFKMVEGNCTGTIYGSEPQPIRITGEENLVVYLRMCRESI